MLKKVFTDSLVQIAILLSLLRIDLDSYLNSDYGNYPEVQEIILGNSLAYTQTQFHNIPWQQGYTVGQFHPKGLSNDNDNLLNSILSDLYSGNDIYNTYNTIISAYLVDVQQPNLGEEQSLQNVPQQGSAQGLQINGSNTQNQTSPNIDIIEPAQATTHGELQEGGAVQLDLAGSTGDELSKEDMDLIDILWRQDLDMGVAREMFDPNQRLELEKEREVELQKQQQKERELDEETVKQEKEEKDAWEDLTNYIIDGETGELLPLPPAEQTESPGPSTTETQTNENTTETPLFLEDAMSLLQNDGANNLSMNSWMENSTIQDELEKVILEKQPNLSALGDTNVSYSRQNSLEMRWRDVASLLELPGLAAEENVTQNYSTTPTTSGLIQNTTFAPQMSPAQAVPSIDLTTSTNQSFVNESLTQNPANTTFGLENSDLLFPNISATVPITMNTSSDFLDDLLEDELSDMEIENTADLPTMQMMDDASSDSAVSSMGSSPYQEWTDSSIGSTSPFDTLEGATGGMHQGGATGFTKPKFEYYDNSCTYSMDPGYQDSLHTNYSGSDNGTSYPQFTPASKKHIHHNHTYPLQPGQQPKEQKKPDRDKGTRTMFSRDEKRAKAMRIPFSVSDIVNSAVEDFNEMLQKYALTEAQLQLVRDIRRRGKNKVAAQNCRKRKMEIIFTLDDEVKAMQQERDRLQKERQEMEKEHLEFKNKFSHLYMEVFRSLRDENGRPYNPQEYSLQQTADGNVFLIPRNSTSSDHTEKAQKKRKSKKQ